MDFVQFDDRSMPLSVKMQKRNGNMEGKHGKKDEKRAEYSDYHGGRTVDCLA